MSNRDLFTTVTQMFAKTQNIGQIAADLYLSRKCVKQVLTLTRLSARLRQAFFDRIIDFNRAKAYAALPKHTVQDRIFMALGPFASAKTILEYAAERPALKPALSLAA